MNFDPAERMHLQDAQCLAIDGNGDEIYIGLNLDQSNEYFSFTRPSGEERHSGESSLAYNARRLRFLVLHQLTRSAQLNVIKSSDDVKPGL
ncbi:hypothetical protein [Methylobacterium sp. V23]|uniref:hypothetical protein n=1 Tax=Methylobacterium sp. V23 TaxID=2044878 RepID=UPI0011B02BE9|nr:hypothetical protein [Methylobacterium sp. V23]